MYRKDNGPTGIEITVDDKQYLTAHRVDNDNRLYRMKNTFTFRFEDLIDIKDSRGFFLAIPGRGLNLFLSNKEIKDLLDINYAFTVNQWIQKDRREELKIHIPLESWVRLERVGSFNFKRIKKDDQTWVNTIKDDKINGRLDCGPVPDQDRYLNEYYGNVA
jgi:hypothetical protein